MSTVLRPGSRRPTKRKSLAWEGRRFISIFQCVGRAGETSTPRGGGVGGGAAPEPPISIVGARGRRPTSLTHAGGPACVLRHVCVCARVKTIADDTVNLRMKALMGWVRGFCVISGRCVL